MQPSGRTSPGSTRRIRFRPSFVHAGDLVRAARLPAHTRTVLPEELIWRIRMQHDPEQTRKAIEAWQI